MYVYECMYMNFNKYNILTITIPHLTNTIRLLNINILEILEIKGKNTFINK